MIYVKQEEDVIPGKVLAVAKRAQEQLEKLPIEERASFIKKKGHVWRGFSKYLKKMSYGKCWYSESNDPQAFFDVDHFRPKLEAKRTETVVDAHGYEWLAFDWHNFRLSSQRANRLSTDEDTDEVVGKGSWFPLIEGSPKACWEDRCVKDEKPMLLDPVDKDDVRLIDVRSDGYIVPSQICLGTSEKRVDKTIELYGLNLPGIREARMQVIRNVTELHETLFEMIEAVQGQPDGVADKQPIQRIIKLLRKSTLPESPFSRTARAQLARLPSGAEFIVTPEAYV